MRAPLTTKLRFGWTTGTCATAALNASYTAMVTGKFPDIVFIETPGGKIAELAVHEPALTQTGAIAAIIKDAGDDPDVTHGAIIRVHVAPATTGSGVCFHAGEGVGIITRPGLPVPVGEPAINPVPRQMMKDIITKLADEFHGPVDLDVTISVDGGADIALKTWNPRLGIEGGISILGTTGIVRPYSCSAWIASIHRGIDVARANRLPHAIATTGASSETALRKYVDVLDIACLDMGDFIGGMLKYLRRHPVPQLTIAGGVGKLVKFAQGAIDLHSGRSQVDFARLADWAAGCGMVYRDVRDANTVLEVIQRADEGQKQALGQLIALRCQEQAHGLLKGTDISLAILVMARDGSVIGRGIDASHSLFNAGEIW
jgi:cobalt-precorrin-5B (C1)-methyltransferase